MLAFFVYHARNQEFFRAGEVSWNKDSSIKKERKEKKTREKIPSWENFEAFSPRCSKTAF